MRARFIAWLHAYLVAIDAAWFLRLRLLPYVLADNGDAPSPYETISSFTGRMANVGVPWALRWQPRIDRLFELLGSTPGHCQRSIIRADWLTAPLP